MKSVLLLGAGQEQVAAIRIAQQLGLRVVAADGNPSALGLAVADVGVAADIRDVSAMTELGRAYGVSGVFSHAVEIPGVVARVAKALDLPGLSPETADRATNKLARIRRFAACGVPCALFASASSVDEALTAAERIGFPLVAKPTDGAGARGVRKVESIAEVPAAFEWAVAHSRSAEVVLEQFMKGMEISTETVIATDGLVTTGFADRDYSRKRDYEPYLIEAGHTVPSLLRPTEREAVVAVVERAIRALELDFGVAKGDILIDASGPKVIEMACRTSGGRFCSDVVPLASGVNILEPLIRQAVGEPIRVAELAPQCARAAAQRFFLPPPGRVRSVRGIEVAWAVPGVYDIRFDKPLESGTIIPRVRSHADRVGHVIAVGSTRSEAVESAETAVCAVEFDIDPVAYDG